MEQNRILVIGACGQIGAELTAALQQKFGRYNVVAADKILAADVFLDVLNHQELENVVRECGITQIYLLAAMFSATGEKNRQAAWNLNVKSLIAVLDIAVKYKLNKVFWPSSSTVFGPGSPKYNCPQETLIQPNTVYGISKRTGEYWCNYYFEQFGVDVRSLRFPGLISYTVSPKDGITDYAVDIFHQALEKQQYTCFLAEDNCLPMMYVPDAVRATLELMDAPKEKLTIRTSYNLAGLSFAPCDLVKVIRDRLPGFCVNYAPDHRNVIACNWPASFCEEQARKDWGWVPGYDLGAMATDMLVNIAAQKHIHLPVMQKEEAAEFYPHETF